MAVPLYRVAGSQSWPNGRPYAYGARVTEFAPFMQHYFSDAPTTRGTNNPSPFRGRRGVIFFSVSGWRDANGHFDMWDGVRGEIRYSEYFARSTTVTLWQHVIIRSKEIQRADGVCTAVYQMEGV
nr:T6SS effector amidase Tae4 family protein [Jannaschia aquimarina]